MHVPTWLALAVALTMGACAVDRHGLSDNDGSMFGTVGGTGGGGAGGLPDTGGTGGNRGGTGGIVDTGGSGGTATGGRGGAPPDAGMDVATGDTGGPDAGVIDARPVDLRVISPVGCADGVREGYVNMTLHPAIAACSGAWDVPGLVDDPTFLPQCNRQAGNTGVNMDGTGCSAEDLCADGWHVCLGAAELNDLNETCAAAIAPFGATSVFFVTRQHVNNNGACVAATNNNATTNNLHGCGNFGLVETGNNCDPLNFLLRQQDCDLFPNQWSCGQNAADTMELEEVFKPGINRGGVLCCRD